MFPYVRLGSWLIQMPFLALLVGLWGGMILLEHESKRMKLNPSMVANLVIYSTVAGIIGARLGYALQFRALYASKPLSLLALTPTTLSPSMGFLVGLITFWILIDYQNLPVRPALDALAPGLALFMIFVGVSHILSGDAYGAPTRVPWAIRLWNEYRHPSQFYETFAALIIFLVILKRFPKPDGAGLNFGLTIALTAASRVFLETFRGDSVFWPAGFRAAQVIALVLMAVGFYWMRRWMNVDPRQT
jgi:phosphatidylglycerol:prolipoprotein diacylglycerol transferase